jgi:putative ABC transport system permease protein
MKTLTRGHVKAGLLSVKGAKMRSFWTMLGVIIGVASVITVVGIGEGVKQQIGGEIHRMGTDVITIRPGQLNTNSASFISGLNISAPLTPKDIAAVKNTKGVVRSAPLTIAAGQVDGPAGVYRDGPVVGTSSDLPSLLNQSIAYGSFLTPDDEGTNTAVVGQHAAETIFNEDVPLGQSFTFHGEDFIVRGIFNQFPSTPLSQQLNLNNAIFIPNDVAQTMTKSTAPTYEILAKADSPAHTAQVADNVKRSIDATHGGQSDVSVLRGSQNISASNSILDLLTRMIAGVAAISLLVGGIGIMNVMLVSVTERMHEIGIRKAVGATNRQILNQFLVESSVLSLTGGLIGITLAFAVDGLLRAFTSLQPVISWQLVLLATGVSLAVGILFGSIPAFKAARKDPIDALRAQ